MRIFSRGMACAVAAVMATVVGAPRLVAQTKADYEALKREIETLRQQHEALQKQVDTLTAQVRSAVPPPPIDTLKLERAPLRGSAAARVTLVEVGDFECPFCGRYFSQTMPLIQKDYIDTAKISYAFVNMPLSIHPNAFNAAQAAACAAEQGKFWEMHDRLFGNQAALGLAALMEKSTGIVDSPENYKTCLNTAKHTAEIRSDMSMAQAAGVTATPTFFIGSLDSKAKTLKVVRKIVGAKPYAAFQEALDDVLRTAAAGGK